MEKVERKRGAFALKTKSQIFGPGLKNVQCKARRLTDYELKALYMKAPMD